MNYRESYKRKKILKKIQLLISFCLNSRTKTVFLQIVLEGFNGVSESQVSTLLRSFDRKSLIKLFFCKYSGLFKTAA
jgi:hypothetical protein